MKQKHYSILPLFILLLLVTGQAMGNPIDRNRAQQTAEDFFARRATTRSGTGAGMKLVYTPPQTKGGTQAVPYYVFAPAQGRGFVIVSGDDGLTPVAGYAFDTEFDATRMPDALKAWLDEYARYVDGVQTGQAKAVRRDAAQTRAGGTAIEPLVKTQWNQSAPYNKLCPVISDVQAPSGCVATAVTQVMYFHRWPDTGEGTVDGLYDQYTPVDLSTSNYDWDNMLLTYNGEEGTDYTTAQADAVAKLMYEFGLAVEMQYGMSVSNAFSAAIPNALVSHFKYSPSTTMYYDRNIISTADWIALIRANLEARQPMVYSGSGDGMGHAFVCDGIDSDDMLHINWGWGGSCDGYFDMALLAPDNIGIGGGNGYYFEGQGIVAGIRPRTGDETTRCPAITIPRPQLAEPTVQELDGYSTSVSFFMSFDEIWNHNGHKMPFCIGFCTKQPDDTYVLYYLSGSYRDTAPGHGWIVNGTSLNFNVQDLANGAYELVLCYREGGTDSTEPWIPIYTGSYPSTVILEKTDTQVSIRFKEEGMSAADLMVAGTQPQDLIFYKGSSATITVELENRGEEVFMETTLWCKLLPASLENPTQDDFSNAQTAGRLEPYVYGNSTMLSQAELSWLPEEPGDYRLWIGMQDYIAGRFVALPSAKPLLVTILDIPEETMPVLTRPFTVLTPELTQSYRSPWFRFDAAARAVGQDGQAWQGDLAIYIKKNDDPEGKEYKLIEMPDATIDTWGGDIESSYTSTRVINGLEPGEYTACLKYTDSEGIMQTMTPAEQNSGLLTILPSVEPLPYLAGPMVINDGNPVPRGSTGKAVVTLASRMDYSGEIMLSSFEVADPEETRGSALTAPHTKVELQAGVPKKFTINYTCYEGAALGLHEAVIYFQRMGTTEFWDLTTDVYLESAQFEVQPELTTNVRLAAPMVINDGQPVVQGSRGTITTSLVCDKSVELNIFPRALDDEDHYAMNWSTGQPVSFKARIPQQVTLNYECEEATKPGTYEASLYYLDDNGIRIYVQIPSEYLASTQFQVTDITGIEDEQADNPCRLICLPDAFRVENVPQGSVIRVTGIGGSLLHEQTATATRVDIGMAGSPKGFYIVTIQTPEGKLIPLKGILR